MMKSILVVLALAALALCSPPLLFVQKSIPTLPPGQHFPMDVRIDVFNAAPTPATDVVIFDTWGQYFDVVGDTTRNEEGLMVAELGTIPANTNVSHIFHLKPLVSGMMKPLPVTVRYHQVLPDEEEEEGEKSFKTAHAEMLAFRPIYILTELEYRRYVSSHMMERCVYSGMVAAFILIPFAAFWLQKGKKAEVSRKKK